jgi:ribosomal protein L30E
MAEATKCIVICANCHRKLHAREDKNLPKNGRSENAKYLSELRSLAAARLLAWKAERGCSRCSESDSACLDFHHRDPSKKKFQVGWGVWEGYTWNKLMKEAAKCIIVCANCHRKLHAKLREEEETNMPL